VNQTTNGFFLHRTTYSTKSLLLSFYTKDQGLIQLTSFSSRKPLALIPFALYELEFQLNPKYPHGTLKKASPVYPINQLDINPLALANRYFVCDVVYQTTSHKNKDEQGFNTLLEMMLDLGQRETYYSFPCFFLIHWMKSLGILPEPIQKADTFDMQDGVLTFEGLQQPPAAVFVLNELLNDRWNHDNRSLKETFDLLLQYLELHLPNVNVNKTRNIIHEIFH
jgi:hypothetical protein